MTKSIGQNNQKTFRLTGTKTHVVSLLAEFFCLRTNDIAKLLYGEATKINQISTNRTLRLLLKQGLVNRLPYLDLNLARGGITFAYGLSDSGVSFMKDKLPFLNRSIKTFDEHSQRTLDHELEISFFHVALKTFCMKHGLVLHWRQKDLKKTIAPDAYFAITDLKYPEGQDTLHYFLEVERAKIGNLKDGEPSIIRKLAKYHEYFNTDACQKDWTSFRKFRVIVVQRTEAKRDFLLSKLKEGYAHRMFWLTTEAAYKEDIGAEIFRTPKDVEQRSYSFMGV
jgi:hypothetical protein